MAEVEAEAVWINQGTGLVHVGAQHRPQASMQQMGAAVVSGCVQSADYVNLGGYLVPQGNVSLLHYAPVDDETGNRALSVLNPYYPVWTGDRSLVAELAAALGVERRLRKDHLDPLALGGMARRFHLSWLLWFRSS